MRPQRQPYEIKVRKTGDFSELKGKLYKSVLHMGFQERRLQYMEKEQIAEWHAQKPEERIIEIDVPLSYGILEVSNCPQNINRCEFLWDPMTAIGVFLKVNCISTEFTPKKHGGEKGVPFRILIETYAQDGSCERLHAGSCQVKVFKPKGADRKHKTDKEKICRRLQSDKEKYQPQYEYTVFKDVGFAEMWTADYSTNSSHSAFNTISSPTSSSPMSNHNSPQSSIPGVSTDLVPEELTNKDNPAVSTTEVQEIAQTVPDNVSNLTPTSSNIETIRWLQQHKFGSFLKEFAHFSGADLINLKRRDLIEICGLPSGIRLYNSLHIKPGCPCLTIYVRLSTQQAFHAVYFTSFKFSELEQRLKIICNLRTDCSYEVFISGPSGIHIICTDEVIQNMAEESMFIIKLLKGNYKETHCILMKMFNS